MNEVKAFYRKVWREYDDPRWHPVTASCLGLQRRLLAICLERHKPRRVLDLGCGPAPVLRPGQAPLVVSADLVPEMLADIRRRLGCSAVCLDARALPFRSRIFDLVWCGLLVDHVPEAGTWVQELARVVLPGGILGLACWERSLLPRDRYPQDRSMRYTCSSGEELDVPSYPNWTEAMEELRRLDPNLSLESHPVVPGQYELQVAFATIR